MNFTFGQQISNAVGRTLERNSIAEQQARELQRLIDRDMFTRQIQGLQMKMQQKRLQLEQDKYESEIVADAMDRAHQREMEKAALQRQAEQDQQTKEYRETQIKNLESLIDSRNDKGGDGSSRKNGALVTLLQNMAPQARTMTEKALEAQTQYMQAKSAYENASGEDKPYFKAQLQTAEKIYKGALQNARGVTDVIGKINKELGVDIDLGSVLDSIDSNMGATKQQPVPNYWDGSGSNPFDSQRVDFSPLLRSAQNAQQRATQNPSTVDDLLN